MQGLGSGAVAIAGSDEQRRLVLPKVRRGEWLAAFALSEKDAGSDVAAMACSAREDGNGYRLDGEKTWISNGGIADVYTSFARTGEAPGARGLSAFLVFPDDPGFSIAERIDVMAPHPLATLRFEGCRLPADRRLGAPGEGFKIAMRTLDIFRASVAAAALGFARRAFDEALAHAKSRKMFGATLADLQLTQAALGEMATEIDAAALLTYRAAWRRDVQKLPTTVEAAMAKMTATETAQRVIDRALQMFGGRGVRRGEIVESLYREIRALRIYEGATEVQKLIVARELIKARPAEWEGVMLKTLQPEGWAKPAGYANGVSARGRVIHVAGQIGWNKDSKFETDDFVGQVRQSCRTSLRCSPRRRAPRAHRLDDLVFHQQARVSRQPEGRRRSLPRDHRPSFPGDDRDEVAALMEDRAKVEIQAVAIVPDP